MTDNINHPPHYNLSKAECLGCERRIECIDITRHMNFNIGNAFKYLWRFEHKGGVEDLKKAIWYIQNEIQKYEKSPDMKKYTQLDRIDIICGSPINPDFEIPLG